MHEIEEWLEEAAEQQKVPIRKLPDEDAIRLQSEVIARYVSQSSPCTWWMNLTKPVDEHYDRKLVSLSSVMPIKSGACWLIPDTDAARLPVYEIDVAQVEQIIEGCPGFEYYVVAHDFSWLVVETHHDQFYVCRDADTLPRLTR